MPASFCRLPLSFDVERLRADLAGLSEADWQTHFNADYHNGGWAGIALRSADGKAENLYPGPLANTVYADTPVFAKLVNIRSALKRFECPLDAVRLLRLTAGGQIHEHRDYDLGLERGVVRMHIPLITGADVEFYLDGARVLMEAGECWYLDLSLPHRVQNLGRLDRIHLVLDAKVNDWFRSLMPRDAEVSAQRQEPRYVKAVAASLQQQFDRFRAVVLRDERLQERLRRTDDIQSFVENLVAAGREAGFTFTGEEVKAALAESRRAAIERMIIG